MRRMRVIERLGCLWPGFPQTWRDGTWSGAVLAAGFAALFNFVLLATFVWTGWIHPVLLLAAWVAVVALWLASVWIGLEQPTVIDLGAIDELFGRAQIEYLRGHWFEAETLLSECLERNDRDADARLLLATLKRRTGRPDEARRQLSRLARIEQGDRLSFEIEREERLLKASEMPENNEDAAKTGLSIVVPDESEGDGEKPTENAQEAA